MTKTTPMMAQYYARRQEYPDCLLLFRLGDFYELFEEQAEKVSEVLGLTLTHRGDVPMCGMPYHAADTYIQRLVSAGFAVAVCEQVSPVGESALVERVVTRVVSAGTIISDDKSAGNNYICCFARREGEVGAAAADLSTGELYVKTLPAANAEPQIISFIDKYAPSEIIFRDDFVSSPNTVKFAEENGAVVRWLNPALRQLFENDRSEIAARFSSENAKQAGVAEDSAAEYAACTLLGYFKYCRKREPVHIRTILRDGGGGTCELSHTTRDSLELLRSSRRREKKGSLFWVLDRTVTSAGRRKLQNFINAPLTDTEQIRARHEAVAAFVSDVAARENLRDALRGVSDIEKILSRVVYGASKPRDVIALGVSAAWFPTFKNMLSSADSVLLRQLGERIPDLSETAKLIQDTVYDPDSDTESEQYDNKTVIKSWYDSRLDNYRGLQNTSNEKIAEIERREREDTGIKNLRIGYNRVYGYYIEVSKAQTKFVPQRYTRRQTLTNGERYITDELKKAEDEMLSASAEIDRLEAEIFETVLQNIRENMDGLRDGAESLAETDVLAGFAQVAVEQRYCRPEMTEEYGELDIRGGRHPVIEKRDSVFTPNDCRLSVKETRMMVITGPNMGGKSTYMRQVALCAVMAQIGSFVPADSAVMPVFDSVHTRIGASDDIFGGKSTFMVEMTEVSEILKNASRRSLVILDEIGRGTGTCDGLALSWSIAAYICQKIGCLCLLSTHYHELLRLEKQIRGIRNYNVLTGKNGDKITFLHKIVAGGTSESFGVEVAKLAGLPDTVVTRAAEIAGNLKRSNVGNLLSKSAEQKSEQNETAALDSAQGVLF